MKIKTSTNALLYVAFISQYANLSHHIEIKKAINAGEDVGYQVPYLTPGGNGSWCHHSGRRCGDSGSTRVHQHAQDPSLSLLSTKQPSQ